MWAKNKEVNMGLQINTNVTSLSAQRTLSENSKQQAGSLTKLSSGSRIVRSADDAAGLAISEKLKSQIRGINQANRNTNDAIALVQVAEGGLSEISNILVRMRELSVQTASDTVGDVEREFTDLEYQNLKQEVERISRVTDFNGKRLLSGEDQTYDFQVGINNNPYEDRISFKTNMLNTTLGNLGIDQLTVSTKENAQGSFDVLDRAIEKVSGQRAELGARQNRMISTARNLQVASENLNSANSQIRDVDYASETANNVKYSILNSAGVSVLSQANSRSQNALKLIG